MSSARSTISPQHAHAASVFTARRRQGDTRRLYTLTALLMCTRLMGGPLQKQHAAEESNLASTDLESTLCPARDVGRRPAARAQE
jgi:hypothetical protein